MGRLIAADRSIIPACDVPDMVRFQQLVEATAGVTGLGAYKVGAVLTIRYGLAALVAAVRDQDKNVPVIYDHQKCGTDIPEMGVQFAAAIKGGGATATIIFPLSGAKTEVAYIEACKAAGLTVIVGGEMTHPGFKVSDGGFIADEKLEEMYRIAADNGVVDFVVPGNKPDRVAVYRELLAPLCDDDLTFYAPGFIAQGGVLSEAGQAAGARIGAIIGRAIYDADDKRAAAIECASQIV